MAERLKQELFPYYLQRVSTHPVGWALRLSLEELVPELEASHELERELEGLREELGRRFFEAIPTLGGEERAPVLKASRQLKKALAPLAAPLFDSVAKALPNLCEELQLWQSKSARFDGGLRALEASYSQARLGAQARLRKLLENELVQESVFLSSARMFESLERYLRQPEAAGSKAARQFERSFAEHLARACGKTTPRGLLTGVRLESWRGTSDRMGQRRTYLTLPVCNMLAKQISKDGDVWLKVVPRVTPDAYVASERVHFEVRRGEERLSLSVPLRADVQAFMDACAARERAARDVIGAVSSRLGMRPEDATKMYVKLCEAGLLHGQLQIPYNESDGVAFLARWLRENDGPPGWIAKLGQIQDAFAAIDRGTTSFAERRRLYKAVQESLAALLPEHEIVSRLGVADLVVVETVTSAPCLPRTDAVAGDVLAALETCHALTAASGAKMHADRYAGTLLRRLRLPDGELIPLQAVAEADYAETVDEAPAPASGARQARELRPLFQRLRAAIEVANARRLKSIDLLATPELETLTGALLENAVGADAIEVRVVAASAADFEAGRYQLVLEGMANNLSAAFGRYSRWYGDDGFERAQKAHLEWLRSRHAADKEWIDLSVLPVTRTAGALSHLQAFDRCIELLGARSERAGARLLPLHELFVRRNPDGGAELVWKTAAAERRLHPHYMSYVGGTEAFPHVELLRRMGWAVAPSLRSWDGEEFWSLARHLPRLTAGHVVLSRESWRWTAKELTENLDESPWAAFKNWTAWRRAQGLPRHVFVKIREAKPFWVDFLNPFMLDALATELRPLSERENVLVTEMLPEPASFLAELGGERVALQLIVGVSWEKVP